MSLERFLLLPPFSIEFIPPRVPKEFKFEAF
jgi:hypothetical protein